MTVTRVMAPGQPNPVVIGENLKVLPNNHGPQTDRLVYGLGAFKGYDSGDPPAASAASTIRPSSTASSRRWPAARASSPASSTIPISSTRRASSTSSTSARGDLGGIQGARNTPIEDVFTGFNVFSIALEVPTADLFPNGFRTMARCNASSTDSLLRVWVEHQPPGHADGRRQQYHYRPSRLGQLRAGRPQCAAALQCRLVGTQRQTLYLHTDPMKDVTRFGDDILYPVSCATPKRSASTKRSAFPPPR